MSDKSPTEWTCRQSVQSWQVYVVLCSVLASLYAVVLVAAVLRLHRLWTVRGSMLTPLYKFSLFAFLIPASASRAAHMTLLAIACRHPGDDDHVYQMVIEVVDAGAFLCDYLSKNVVGLFVADLCVSMMMKEATKVQIRNARRQLRLSWAVAVGILCTGFITASVVVNIYSPLVVAVAALMFYGMSVAYIIAVCFFLHCMSHFPIHESAKRNALRRIGLTLSLCIVAFILRGTVLLLISANQEALAFYVANIAPVDVIVLTLCEIFPSLLILAFVARKPKGRASFAFSEVSGKLLPETQRTEGLLGSLSTINTGIRTSSSGGTYHAMSESSI